MQFKCPTCGELWRPGHPHNYATVDEEALKSYCPSGGLSLEQWHDKITRILEWKRKRGQDVNL